MKRADYFFRFMLLLVLISFASCSGDSDNENVNQEPITEEQASVNVTTLPAENVAEGMATLGGNITITGNTGLDKRGVCWADHDNPVIESDNNSEYITAGIGEFKITVSGILPNKTYYVRAYAITPNGIIYGNTVTFSTSVSTAPLSTLNPINITSAEVILRGHYYQAPNASNYVGFVYATSQNPTINDTKINKMITGEDDYEMPVNNLIPKTVYYVKSYVISPNGTPLYGEQKEFKTAGYSGPAGGYVAYDKGEVTDGWRYLEFHPTGLNYGAEGAKWSTSNILINGLSDEIGTGLQNSEIISSNVSGANCAAKLCLDLNRNGYSDWFLASSKEMLLIANSLLKVDVYVENNAWTSTQYTIDKAYGLGASSFPFTYVLDNYYDKQIPIRVYPVRRY